MLPTINTAASISHTGHHPDISTQLTADAVPHERRTIQIHRRTRFASSSALSLFFVQVLFFHCSQQSLSLSLSLTVPLVLSLCLTHCACVLCYLTITCWLSGFLTLSEFILFSTPSSHSVWQFGFPHLLCYWLSLQCSIPHTLRVEERLVKRGEGVSEHSIF